MMTDGPSRDGRSDDYGWDRLRSTSEALAEPGEQLYQSMKLGPGPLPVAPQLPTAELLVEARRLSNARRVRDRLFGRDLFPNPAWNILLDLFIAGEEGRNVTIKSACSAAGVPQSTALRHIAHLIEVRLAVRRQHPSDARSAYLKLSERGRAKMVELLSLTAACPDAPGA
jgi:DNA-binding MarR family transcriptional regulator